MTDYAKARSKVSEAKDHLKTLDHHHGEWLKEEQIRIEPSRVAGAQSVRYLVRVSPGVVEEVGDKFGRCVDPLRDALDLLAQSLAVRNGANPDDAAVSFPICDTREEFLGVTAAGAIPDAPPPGSGAYKIRALGSAEQAFIELLQPYHRRGRRSELAVLQHLSVPGGCRFTLERTYGSGQPDPADYAPVARLADTAPYATVTAGSDGLVRKPRYPDAVGVELPGDPPTMPILLLLSGDLLPAVEEVIRQAESQFR